MRERGVAAGLAVGDLQQRAPDGVLELGAGGAQRDGEDAALADEVLAQLHSGELAPTYVTSRPNGPGCEPECRGANAEVALP